MQFSYEQPMLTEGETLLIQRRRAGLSQKVMGDKFDINRHIYGKRERDQETANMVESILGIEDLCTQERCVIYRKRAGLTQREVASLLGLSRYWLNQKEIGRVDCSDLLKFWEQRQ